MQRVGYCVILDRYGLFSVVCRRQWNRCHHDWKCSANGAAFTRKNTVWYSTVVGLELVNSDVVEVFVFVFIS